MWRRPRQAIAKWPSGLQSTRDGVGQTGRPSKRRAISRGARCERKHTGAGRLSDPVASNVLLADADVGAEIEHLDDALARAAAPIVLVANEVGFGIVPDNALGRRFRDLQGLLNQRIAARADRVFLVVAGLPLTLKGSP